MHDTHTEDSPIWLREELRWFLEILTLSSFAVAQPVLDVFGKSPETFVFRGAGRLDIVLFAVIIAVAPALIGWSFAFGTRVLGSRVRSAVQYLAIAGMLSVVGVQLLKRTTPLLGSRLALLAAASATIVTLLVARSQTLRAFLRFGWVASIAFVLIFLLVSPVSRLVLPPPADAVGISDVARQAGGKPPSALMVIFDQLPLLTLLDADGKIDGERFPNFARLAGDATWYRNYTVTAPLTFRSMPTIMTGRYLPTDSRPRRPNVSEFPENLFSLVQRTHRLNAYELVTRFCPIDPCVIPAETGTVPARPASLPLLLGDAVGIAWEISWVREIRREITGQFEEELVPAREDPPIHERRDLSPEERDRHIREHGRPYFLTNLLPSIRPNEEPTFHFLHVMLPHYPWRFFPSGVQYLRPEDDVDLPRVRGSKPSRWVNEPSAAEVVRLRHVLQTQFADRLLGDILKRLEETGNHQNTLLIVTSDHGYGLHAGRARANITDQNMHEMVWVPMLVRAPGQVKGAVDDRLFDAVDLLPTIADHLGIPVPWEVDGISMLAADSGRGSVKRMPGGKTLRVEEAWSRFHRESFSLPRDGMDTAHPYPMGTHPHLLGEPIESLPRGAPARTTVALDLPRGLFDEVDIREGPLPALVTGAIEPEVQGAAVVVALNGRVAGVVRAYRTGHQGGRFAVLIPDSYFRRGRNVLDLFLLDGGVLRPLS